MIERNVHSLFELLIAESDEICKRRAELIIEPIDLLDSRIRGLLIAA